LKDYKTSLSPNTAEVLLSLSKINEIKNFTLIGDSALSIYLNHRISEDLDFFSPLPSLQSAGIDNLLNEINTDRSYLILNSYTNGLDLSINGVKVTFFANNWDRLNERKILLNNSFIGNLELITAMKMNTLSLRAKYRDYYDLYILNREVFEINEIYKLALEYIPGMTKKIFSMQLIYIDDIDDEQIDHLNPKYKLSLFDIRKHFETELKKIL
jgi:hypothetical protein